MSIDKNWPAFPKNISEKVWQKKKGILAVKKTGVSELIKEAESAFKALKPQLYSRGAAIDVDTKEAAEKAAKDILGDTKNIKTFTTAMQSFATECKKKATDYKSNKLVPSGVRDFLNEMAEDALKLAEEVTQHAQTAANEVQEALDGFNKDKNLVLAKERIETVNELIVDWNKFYPGKMKELDVLNKELELLLKEMDARLEGRVNKPAEELKVPLKEVMQKAEAIQNLMLSKKAYETLKVVREVRGIVKTIRSDPAFMKTWVDPFEKRANAFLDERQLLDMQASAVLGNAQMSHAQLQDGLKDEKGVMAELEKFLGFFYDELSPTSVTKAKEIVADLNQTTLNGALELKKPERSVEAMRKTMTHGKDCCVKLDVSNKALSGTLKTALRLMAGRFKNHAAIGTAAKKMAGDLKQLQIEINAAVEKFGKVEPLLSKAIQG